MPTIRTKFIPKDHGFKFVNRFESAFLHQVFLPFAGKKSLGSLVYGLCGGMCFAAQDFFYAGKPVPPTSQVDEVPFGLFRFLWDRQMDSLTGPVLVKLIKWMLYADSTVARLTANEEVPDLKASLEAGKPAVLALVRQKGLGDPTQNHQVLAVAYDYEPTSQDLSIHLYDPNHPGATPAINLNLARPSQGIHITQSTGEALRAFFIIPYERTSLP
jgi:hypothetical protein